MWWKYGRMIYCSLSSLLQNMLYFVWKHLFIPRAHLFILVKTQNIKLIIQSVDVSFPLY